VVHASQVSEKSAMTIIFLFILISKEPLFLFAGLLGAFFVLCWEDDGVGWAAILTGLILAPTLPFLFIPVAVDILMWWTGGLVGVRAKRKRRGWR
jgi:hypothetical protein